MGVILETGPDEYRRTGLSDSLCSHQYIEFYRCVSSRITDGVLALPAYLKDAGYQNPSNGNDCAFQLKYNTKSHFFDFIKSNPKVAAEFHNNLSTYSQGRLSWTDPSIYDVTQLIQGMKIGEDEVVLVDVGGGQGHDISEFRRQLPNITGARAYFMHRIFHDWADEESRKILKNLTPAMKRGYSKLLIHEQVIPETRANWESTSLDLMMMAQLGGMERLAADWKSLLESVGLKITKIWTPQTGDESLVECELA
ncbi:uncharacterized protein N7443_000362 [Penicillium atrosanguineum]|uniref:uncharacterized protein n=1 Tax=Penicillium atrosanguineum TaxID=1132637 RepID=UPI00239B7221|nr:uncharacterized protein N7443_000362 [Penicillium atrosanguineum]KAJ5313478.1 hypothetical protein N7443_000362 [Penicillium atrosanguineum]